MIKKLLILNLFILATLVSCGKKENDSDKPGVVRPPQTGETTGSTGGGTSGGTSGSTSGGSSGGSSNGGSSGGSTGGTSGGSSGGTSGGSNGGSTGGATPAVTLYVGNSLDAHDGIDTTGFSGDVDLENASEVDFNQFKKGKHKKLGSFAENGFEFSVSADKLGGKGGGKTFEEIFGTKNYKFKLESPVSQNGTKGKDSGIETKTGLFAIKKITAVWKFERPISFWGASLIDVESTEKAKAKLRVFDCESNLLEENTINYPDGENGNKQIHFVGFKSKKSNICAVTVTVGDFSIIGGITQGLFRAIAIDDFVYGE